MPMRGELRPVEARPYASQSAAGKIFYRLRSVISSADLKSVVIFSALGLLATIDAVLQFPNFGAMVAALALSP